MAEDIENLEQEGGEPNSEDVAKAVEALENRCKNALIPFSKEKDLEGTEYYLLHLPNGREKRTFGIFDNITLNKLLQVPFEKYTFLGDYEAICCYETSTIEAPIRAVGVRFIGELKRAMQKKEDAESEDASLPLISLAHHGETGEQKIVIGPTSNVGKVLMRRASFGRRTTSLRLEGFKVSTHDEALAVLESISGSLFLQIDLTYDVPLGLFKTRKLSRRLKKNSASDKSLTFPNSSYDSAPLSLYFYARSAGGMPLLQFLAYYQTIEFYFPTFSQADALRRIKNVLKDPTFRSDREADLTRLLTSTRAGMQSGFGDERSQLRSTIQECVDASELRRFLETDSQAKDFFSSKVKGLTEHKLPIANTEADLRNDVADRIYDIRCKVVHTKSGVKEGELELLLPYSKEAGMLQFDIDLLQFIASKVLIAASSSMTL